MRPSQFRVSPGTRPLAPVRLEQIPDDWMCTWVYRLVRGDGRQVTGGFWELKYVNAACLRHARLPAAA